MISSKTAWQHVAHSYITDDKLRERIDKEGFCVHGRLSETSLEELKSLFASTHHFENGEGGMFYSVYSQDLVYRRKVHDDVGAILKPYLDQWLIDYKMMLNSYIVKASGPRSEFYVHQDTTGLDEFAFSPLSLWIPLEDITEQNGAMCVMPGSQKLFSPYRSISFPAPYDDIHFAVRRYLKPLFMKAGEILVFDNRIVHNSMQNLSGKERVVVISGIFPNEATLQTCWKNPGIADAKIEVIQHKDDYLLTNPNFLVDCHARPTTGDTIALVEDEWPKITEAEFAALCEDHGIAPVNYLNGNGHTDCNMIVEPLSQHNIVLDAATVNDTHVSEPAAEIGFFDKLKNIFSS